LTQTSKYTIHFTLIVNKKEYRVQASENQYYSLMELISAYTMITGFGTCSGMGSCGTCLVSVSENFSSAGRFVLACNTKVNDELAIP
jgi:ferredoxin